MIRDIYSLCIRWQLLDEPLLQNYILLLLSYGAKIYSYDVDIFYSLATDKDAKFFETLLSMELQKFFSDVAYVTFMYFKYTLVPSLDIFLVELLDSYRDPEYLDKTNIEDIRDAIRKLSELFAFNYARKEHYREVFQDDEEITLSLTKVKCFPSLIQLSRDATRKALCKIYNIKHISQFYTLINNLDIPKFIKLCLVYKQKIYKYQSISTVF